MGKYSITVQLPLPARERDGVRVASHGQKWSQFTRFLQFNSVQPSPTDRSRSAPSLGGRGGRSRYDFANILFAGPCNLRCPTCIGKQIDPALNRANLDEFPPRNLEAFATLLQRHGVRQVVLTGTTTDPQIYRHEARLIRWLRERLPEARLSLHTNGQLALKKMDIFNLYDRVVLSLPSFDSAIYDKMTGSTHVPDLAAIVQAARVPIKVSCVIDERNAGQLDPFLARCCEIGIRRVVLRQLYGDTRRWQLPPRLRRVGEYRSNPVYDYRGMEVTYWCFDVTTSTSLNLFSDGTISDEYLLARAGKGRT